MKNKKQEFLKKIESTGKLKYKRYLGSPLRYAGGKSLAVGFVAELIPDNVTKIVSPFMGGGSIEIACAKEIGLEVEAYDIFPELVNYWQCQIEQPQVLAKSLSELEPTREEFVRVKEILKKHWKKEEIINDKMKLAQLYYFDHNTSYGPHFLGSPSSVYLDKTRYQKMIEKVSMFNAPKIKVECKSFEEVIPNHPNDLLYCDPPYYLEGDSKTFIGMYPHRNFPIYHKGFKHELLRDLLMNHKGGFILSYNDCTAIRELYKGCNMYSPTWQYTFSQGDTRIGKNRREKNDGSYIKSSHELIIWRLPDE